MRKIRIAQIGLNMYSHATEIFDSLKKQSDLFEIVGYVLPENERERIAHKLVCLEGYPELTLEEVLNDPTIEAVTVETDEVYLTKYALLAAQHHKHIHMEKPGGADPAAFDRLIDTVAQQGKVFHVGYMYRYNPYVAELLEQIERGELGEILSVEAQMNCWHPAETRRWLSTLPGGMMFYLGCHLVDLIFRIQGKPQRVLPLNKSSGLDGVEAKDFGMAVLEYQNGVSFAKTTAVELGGFARRQLAVNGSKATVELCPLEWYIADTTGLRTKRVVHASENWRQEDLPQWSDKIDRYDTMMAAFAAMVRGETENPYTYEYERELYRLLWQCCGGTL